MLLFHRIHFLKILVRLSLNVLYMKKGLVLTSDRDMNNKNKIHIRLDMCVNFQSRLYLTRS